MAIGGIVLIALISQVLSISVGTSSTPSSTPGIFTIGVAIFLSWVSYKSLNNLRSFQGEYVSRGDERQNNFKILAGENFRSLLLLSFFSAYAAVVFWVASAGIGETNVPEVFNAAQAGEADWLQVVVAILYQLAYVGSVVTVVSYLGYIRYLFYPKTKKFRIFLYRLRVLLAKKVAINDNQSIDDALKGRCSTCWKSDLYPEPSKEQFFCSFCGQPFSFDSEPVEMNPEPTVTDSSSSMEPQLPHQDEFPSEDD